MTLKITWQIDNSDLERLREFVESRMSDRFVQVRIERNLWDSRDPPTDSDFWKILVYALLTTQQRSGPQSAVSRFCRVEPFPLSLEECRSRRQDELEDYIRGSLESFGGLRRQNIISDYLTLNLERLDQGGLWKEVRSWLVSLSNAVDPRSERNAANFLADNLKGIGPKQSRNVLQMLGMTRHEIPIDSRITKWLNDFGFPIQLSAAMLSDRHYYEFVSDGIQELCKAADVIPCVLDAAIFSSFDDGGWEEVFLPI